MSMLATVLITFFAVAVTDCFALGETARENYDIMPGVTESTAYVTVDGGYNVRTHLLRIDDDASVIFKASYGGYYGSNKSVDARKRQVKKWSADEWTYETVRKQASSYNNSPDAEGEVVAASNGDYFNVDTGKPKGSLVIEGNIIRQCKDKPFFAVLNDGGVVIRKAGSSMEEVSEAIGGDEIILWNNKIGFKLENGRKPRVGVGICDNGTVLIVNVDGREPASAGVTRKELAQIMKAQGCSAALNLDGGGSASLLTKRSEDNGLKFRGNHSDGPERRVASALLIVKTGEKTTDSYSDPGSYSDKEGNSNIYSNMNSSPGAWSSQTYAKSMNSSSTTLSRSANGIYRYTIKGKAQDGFFAINGKSYLFSKGKGVTAKIKIGNVKYKFKKGVLTSTTDKKAGTVIIGYCGASGSRGQNLLYAYHEGDNWLNIGQNPRAGTLNGKMKNITSSKVGEMPWYSVRADIRKVYIGDGVENLCNYFLYSTKGKLVGGAASPRCQLRSVRLPASLKKIGSYALYNKPALADVMVPAKVTKIGKSAFMYSGKGSIRFMSRKPVSFGKNSMKKTGFKIAYVKKSNSWKKFIKQKVFKKYGYRKSVRYK